MNLTELKAALKQPVRAVFVADAYLDRRRPEWLKYEELGLITYARQPGEKYPMVYIDRACTEVLAVLEAR